MSIDALPRLAGLFLGVLVMTAGPACADALKDEIAPTGKLRVAIAVSPAGRRVLVHQKRGGRLRRRACRSRQGMAEQLGVPVEYVAHQNSGQIVDAVSKGTWDVSFMPKDPEREARMSFGPAYEVADATYIVKPGSTVTDFQRSTSPASRSPPSITPRRCAALSRI